MKYNTFYYKIIACTHFFQSRRISVTHLVILGVRLQQTVLLDGHRGR